MAIKMEIDKYDIVAGRSGLESQSCFTHSFTARYELGWLFMSISLKAVPAMQLSGSVGLPSDIYSLGVMMWEVSLTAFLSKILCHWECCHKKLGRQCITLSLSASMLLRHMKALNCHLSTSSSEVEVINLPPQARCNLQVCTLMKPTRDIWGIAQIRVPEDAPQSVLDLIHACLQQDPKARPTAGQVCDTLDRIQMEQMQESINVD